ncbi:MAG: hypothetical protein CM1200mP41_12570 [Gammaproteobacteria bacterium]|nr:MAG: hypothetical protein CM1200mP41_12570 [Gammaproteobacteria bacterium]
MVPRVRPLTAGLIWTMTRPEQGVYGMTIEEWKRDYQHEATPTQKQKFEETKPLHAVISGH